MNSFHPDLIIEATSVCNRSCHGCYAPNVVSKDSASELKNKSPELFLNQRSLQTALLDLGDTLPIITSIRGGEPTLNPDLPELLMVTKFFTQSLYLETHGRWLLQNERSGHKELLNVIRSTGVIVKVSFDRMHRLGKDMFTEIVSTLEENHISYVVAITEPSLQEFRDVRSTIKFIPDEKIIYQQKAMRAEELIRPRLGIINNQGERRGTLTTRLTAPSAPNYLQPGVDVG